MSSASRMLQLLSLLQTHRYWPGSELAGRLEVSDRTLRRDVDRLRELGYPVHAVRGAAGGYQLQAGAAMPPLLLDDEEAVAIVVGLRAAASGMVEGIEKPVSASRVAHTLRTTRSGLASAAVTAWRPQKRGRPTGAWEGRCPRRAMGYLSIVTPAQAGVSWRHA